MFNFLNDKYFNYAFLNKDQAELKSKSKQKTSQKEFEANLLGTIEYTFSLVLCTALISSLINLYRKYSTFNTNCKFLQL